MDGEAEFKFTDRKSGLCCRGEKSGPGHLKVGANLIYFFLNGRAPRAYYKKSL